MKIQKSAVMILVLALVWVSACGDDDTPVTTTETFTNAQWEPSVTLSASTNHDSSVEIFKDTYTGSGALIGLAQAAPSSVEISLEIDMTTDLGSNGSLSLVAEPTDFPSDLEGSAFPMLVSLNDGTNELINVGGDCATNGYFTCSGSSCSANSSCTVSSPSAYSDRTDWQQFQIMPFGFVSNNIFPTCNWDDTDQACAFNDTFFDSGSLRTGTYTAKYVMLASNYSEISGFTSGIEVKAFRKKDTTAVASADNGAFELNVIIVGAQNIADSQTTKGQTNLNELFNIVAAQYSQSGVGVKIGAINAYEWNSETYASVDVSDLDEMFEAGSDLIGSETEGDAINIFIVSTIPFSSQNLTILGVAGGIKGPLTNGTGASGLAFASFDNLATFNSECGESATSCPTASQESDFVDMGSTISHEIGHYLGLNHLTELSADRDDRIPDTPECDASGGTVSINSCLSTNSTCDTACVNESSEAYNGTTIFCSTETSCQFNHVMWYTTKNFSEELDTGDGNIFSTNSSSIINYNPFVR